MLKGFFSMDGKLVGFILWIWLDKLIHTRTHLSLHREVFGVTCVFFTQTHMGSLGYCTIVYQCIGNGLFILLPSFTDSFFRYIPFSGGLQTAILVSILPINKLLAWFFCRRRRVASSCSEESGFSFSNRKWIGGLIS